MLQSPASLISFEDISAFSHPSPYPQTFQVRQISVHKDLGIWGVITQMGLLQSATGLLYSKPRGFPDQYCRPLLADRVPASFSNRVYIVRIPERHQILARIRAIARSQLLDTA